MTPEQEQEARGNTLVRECSIDDLMSELVARSNVFVAYCLRYDHRFSGPDGAGGGAFQHHSRLHGPIALALGGVEFMRERISAQIAVVEKQHLDEQ